MKYKCEFNLYHWISNDSFDGSNIYGINYFADRFATFYYSKSTHQTTYICGSLDFHTHHECAYAAYVKEGKKSIKIFDTFASNSPRSLRLNLKLCIISHLKLLFRRFPISFFFFRCIFGFKPQKRTYFDGTETNLFFSIRHVQMRLWTFLFDRNIVNKQHNFKMLRILYTHRIAIISCFPIHSK